MRLFAAVRGCSRLFAAVFAVVVPSAFAQISYDSQEQSYSQTFGALGNSGTSFAWTDNVTIPGWYVGSSASSFNSTLSISTGSSTTGSIYSFGGSGSADRAMGSIASGSTTYYYGLRAINNTATTITGFTISYTGEQWRNSAAAAQSLSFHYGIGASSLKTGTYVQVPALSFTSPITGGTSGALNGNSDANRVIVGPVTVNNINWLPGTSLWLRFTDLDDAGYDHGLAIDDFTFAAAGAAPSNNPPAGYYDAAAGLTGEPLAAALHSIISNNSVVPYSSSSSFDSKEALKVLFEDPNDTTKVKLTYSGVSILKTDSSWDREHLWPTARGISPADNAYSDLFNLRPAYSTVNSARNDKFYDNSNLSDNNYAAPATALAAQDTSADTDSWQPSTDERGDIARALFYMDVRYNGGDGNLLDLALDNAIANSSSMAVLSTLVQWSHADPVSEEERKRNATIYSLYQHNRNPFIDHPEYVDSVFGSLVTEADDLDLDGIPNFWEDVNHLNRLDPADANLDSDSDGFTNYEENWMGSNPKDATSPAKFIVDGSSTNTSPDGSAANPYKTIQAAINAASATDLRAIVVRPGTYNERLYVSGKNNIHLFSEAGAAVTIIDGQHVDSSVVRLYGFQKASFVGFTVRNALTSNYGGGLRVDAASGTALIANNVFTLNSSTNTSSGGGGIYLKTADGSRVLNNFVFGNSAVRGGGVLFAGGDVQFWFNNIADNTATGGNGGGLSAMQGVHPDVQNNIIWGNIGRAAAQIHQIATSYARNNILQGSAAGSGNLATDPKFVGKGDYHLTAASPAINAAFALPLVFDFDGDQRPGGLGHRDIGADEYLPADGVDHDGLPNAWEMEYFGTIDYSPLDDPDGDHLTNIYEYTHGTNPNNPDTDGDGVSDGWEKIPLVPPDTIPITVGVKDGGDINDDGWMVSDGNGMPIVYSFSGGRPRWSTNVFNAIPGSSVEFRLHGMGGDGTREYAVEFLNANGGEPDWIPLPGNSPREGDIEENRLSSIANLRWKFTVRGGTDPDLDGLTSANEATLGTNPNNSDSDSDGLGDWVEVSVLHSNPLSSDSDHDGMPDLWEFQNGLNLNDPSDAAADPDHDGLTNLQEYQFDTNPFSWDSDGDTMPDGWEVRQGLNPLSKDDVELSSAWGNGLTNYGQYLDFLENPLDVDGDGLTPRAETGWKTNVALVDSDADGMPDGWEVANGLNPISDDSLGDLDNDGISNLDEYTNHQLPYNLDTDEDGISDGDEQKLGTDPRSNMDGLVAWWRLHDANEYAGISHLEGHFNGQYHWQYSYDDHPWITTHGYATLSGSSAYFTVRDHQALRFSTSTTVALRVSMDDLTHQQRLLSKGDSYQLYLLPNGKLRWDWKTAAQTFSVTSANSLPQSQWAFVAVVMDNETHNIRLSVYTKPNATSPLIADKTSVAWSGQLPSYTDWPLMLGAPRNIISEVPQGAFDDLRIYQRALSEPELAALADPKNPQLEQNQDEDNDGLTTAEESYYHTDPRNEDSDGDGLKDGEEIKTYSSNPRLVDTDGDGLTDYDEVFPPSSTIPATFPYDSDSDHDGLWDGEELSVYHTKPMVSDTDGDGMPDGWEITYGLNPLDARDGAQDWDHDGTDNYHEYLNQVSYLHGAHTDETSSPWNPLVRDDISHVLDADHDGLTDYDEVVVYHTNPNLGDTAGDGLGDLYRVTHGLINPDGTMPPNGGADQDYDGDGQTNGQEKAAGTDPNDVNNISVNLIAAHPITELPKVKLKPSAPDPAPVSLGEQTVRLKKVPSMKATIQESESSPKSWLVGKITVIDPDNHVASQVITPNGVSDTQPEKNLGKSAVSVHTFGGSLDITGFASQLVADAQGYIKVRIKAEIIPQRVDIAEDPDPVDPTDPTDPGTGTAGNGGNGGNGSGSGYSGFGGGVIIGSDEDHDNPPNPPEKPPEKSVNTYSSSNLMILASSVDLDVKEIGGTDYLDESLEDSPGAILVAAPNPLPSPYPASGTDSPTILARATDTAATQKLTWNTNQLIVMAGGSAITSPYSWGGGEKQFKAYAKPGATGSASVSLEAFDVQNKSMGSDSIGLNIVSAALAVDADRDGSITFSNNTSDPTSYLDATSQEKPFRFWVNNDHDIGHQVHSNGVSTIYEEDDVDDNIKDCDSNIIKYKRDLEDFSRLWISVKQLTKEIKKGEIQVKLEFKNVVEGNPSIKIFNHSSGTGDADYLTNEEAAQTQLSPPYNKFLVTVLNGISVEIPTEFFKELEGPNWYMLFEGCSAGKGQLCVSLWKNGKNIGQGNSIWLDLKDITDLYENYSVGDAVSSGVDTNLIPNSLTQEKVLPAPQNESEKDYILFVHGWNMKKWEKKRFAETAFKRLWLQGYKGRFGLFRWPTFYTSDWFHGSTENGGPIIDSSNFDNSEYNAWRSGVGLSTLLANLKGKYNTVHLLAHSMGNVVATESLRGASTELVNTYVASQAAIAAHCYDGSKNDITWSNLVIPSTATTPNVYKYFTLNPSIQFPSSGQTYMHDLHVGAAKWVNYYNNNDYALDGWATDQGLKPDNNYNYRNITGYGWGFIFNTPTSSHGMYFPQDRYEIFSFGAEARSNALGRENGVSGQFDNNEISLNRYGPLHPGHSAQFRSTNMKQKDYWQSLLDSFGLGQLP